MYTALIIIGVLTLVLTCFTLAYYSYLFRHTDHDVSFFISVCIISLVMNLFTNMTKPFDIIYHGETVVSNGALVLGYVYLVVALVFLGVGWAIDAEASKDFYLSIGPWFKETFTDTATLGWKVLSFLVAPAGIALYFVNYKSNREQALTCGKCGAWGLFLWVLLLWTILGIAL